MIRNDHEFHNHARAVLIRDAMKYLRIADEVIAPEHPTFIVTEGSANHLHDYDLAIKMIAAAHDAGADAIKMQTYTADTLAIDCDNE